MEEQVSTVAQCRGLKYLYPLILFHGMMGANFTFLTRVVELSFLDSAELLLITSYKSLFSDSWHNIS